ncbi:MAG: type 1 glutamine amidotransferase [Planctomycetota bacterium]|nr:type 1 glutamine amidotransferase [Planctomycetota bacterium]MCX8040372.1 type 1 glutamine amidotransferase [Planctomycetota bacterium]MDW8373748.1 type 1 glutamine amidotransferase [Planctomycetota bacterium]
MPTPITRLLVLQHVPQEGPGRFAAIAERLGLKVEVLRLDRGDPVPAAPPSGAILLVMGGPMGVADLGDPRWPFLADEVRLLAACLRDEHPTIGVCLGAQLLAHAAGARVAPLQRGDPARRDYEVGWGAVHWLVDPAQHPLLTGLERCELVLHWHGDACALPAGAEHLAATLACPVQAFALRRCVGLQFHVEVDEAMIQAWLADDAAFVRRAEGPEALARIQADTARFAPQVRPRWDRLLANLLRQAMAAGTPR